ncbi:synaptic vesicle glycoprotein 2C-like isoform X2 [Lutzomyia longipalpis]|uniref:synaptic vesicle glycoprotein 2C-like isoform X2 n=1 Tax=Lutzomyia longipalpis TaxID=7200 RepID=UPI0024833F48|nr:synaptic vesicle glycoprotein 2C-like isoform X2 [Lutzomyia longipalpis]
MSTKGTSEDSSEVHQNDGSDGKSFEEAISATGFGLYNILLVATSLIWFSASLNITTSPGLIMPIAQCDLDLDLDRKGWLNSIVYLGMIFGASIWGVVGDMFGRKIIITGGLFLLGTFNILYGFTTSYYMLVILEFFAGFVASGPIGAYMVYVPEFLGVKYRARVMVFVCSFITLGAIVSMLFGLLILTQSINISIGSREYHSWQVYYWACSSFGLIGGCLSLLFPESPKYLMSRGKNAEALKALQRIYSINTRKSSESYPIKSLRDESQSNGQSHQSVESGEKSEKDAKAPSHIFRKAFGQFIPIFQRPYLFNCLLAGFIEFFQLLGVNTMRSWMPQVFALLTTNTSPDEGVCEHIFQPPPDATTTPENQICEVLSDKSIYVNSIIVQGVGVLGVFVAVYLVTIVGNKTILSGCDHHCGRDCLPGHLLCRQFHDHCYPVQPSGGDCLLRSGIIQQHSG